MSTTSETTIQRLEAILAASELSEAEREDLWNAFCILNALEFARKLHGLVLPDELARELLSLKVGSAGLSEDDGLQIAMDRAVANFWKRLGWFGE